MTLILVYNDSLTHKSNLGEEKAYSTCSYEKFSKTISGYANNRIIKFGLKKYERIYFSEVHTCSQMEFQTIFIPIF